ncbi:MAG TPA: YCF48-related protein [Syntrophorhabdaceae bacterium]|jgi:hypothetical protein
MFNKKAWVLATVILGLFISLPLLAQARRATPLDTWVSKNNFSTTLALYAAANDGLGTAFVTVGASGTILNSADGNFWTVRTITGITKHLFGVAYGPGEGTGLGRFVAVGDTKTILYSDDGGATWSAVVTTTLPAVNFRAVTYGNGYFVAVGDGGKIFSSPDGLAWTQQGKSPFTGGLLTTATFYAVSYGNGLFVAVGAGGTVLWSQDGFLWIRNPAIASGGTLTSIAYGKPMFGEAAIWMAVNSSGRVFTSTNATIWTPFTSSQTGITTGLWGVTFSGGIFVAVGSSGKIFTSDDGELWELSTAPFNPNTLTPITTVFRAVGTDGTTFYVVGDAGTILTSSDPRYLPYKSSNLGALTANIYAGGRFLLAGQYGNIFTSTNGNTWSESRLTTTYLNAPYIESIGFGNGLFVAVGDRDEDSSVPVVFTSPDGIAWTQRSDVIASPAPVPVSNQDLLGVTYGNGAYVAVGTAGTIVSSPDGTTWTARSSGTSFNLTSVTYGLGFFVAVGNKTVLTSPDGVTWAPIVVTNPPPFESVTFANVGGTGTFVAVASNGAIYTSTAPNQAWVRETTLGAALYGVTYGSATYGFVAVGAGGFAAYSPTGSTWTAITTRAGVALYGVSFGGTPPNTYYVGSGASSKIFTSPLATP